MPAKLKVLRVEFDAQLQPYEIPAFRGAIALKAGHENDLFHNHLDDTRYLYRYPLIQYKLVHQRPTLICMHEGVDHVHKFFEKPDWNLAIGDRQLTMKIARLDLNQFTMQVWDRPFTYQIRNWIALNQESYRDYQQMTLPEERQRFLETKLVGNILSFAKGINWTVDRRIECSIIEQGEIHAVRVKKISMMGFNLTFKTNIFLPNYMGLGKNVSLGFGVVRQAR